MEDDKIANLLTLDEAKAQLSMEVGQESPLDPHLTSLIQATAAMIARRMGKPGAPLADADTGVWLTMDAIPADIPLAGKMIVAELYANREASLADIPFVEDLIRDYAGVSFA